MGGDKSENVSNALPTDLALLPVQSNKERGCRLADRDAASAADGDGGVNVEQVAAGLARRPLLVVNREDVWGNEVAVNRALEGDGRGLVVGLAREVVVDGLLSSRAFIQPNISGINSLSHSVLPASWEIEAESDLAELASAGIGGSASTNGSEFFVIVVEVKSGAVVGDIRVGRTLRASSATVDDTGNLDTASGGRVTAFDWACSGNSKKGGEGCDELHFAESGK